MKHAVLRPQTRRSTRSNTLRLCAVGRRTLGIIPLGSLPAFHLFADENGLWILHTPDIVRLFAPRLFGDNRTQSTHGGNVPVLLSSDLATLDAVEATTLRCQTVTSKRGEIELSSWRFTREKPKKVLKLSSVQKRKEMGL